jgi:uncharacterized protein (AIM24 family)
MATPQIHPQSIPDGKALGAQYSVEGNLIPTLHLKLDGTTPYMFEHHIFLWKQPQVQIQMAKMAGGFKRLIAGLPIFMTYAEGNGDIAFSRDHPGQIIPIELAAGQSILVREHTFLAVTGNVNYSFERVRGFGSMLFGSQGFFVDRFEGGNGGSTLWLHASGNAFDIELAAGESIDVEPGAWVYREESVRYEQQVFGLKAGLLGGGGNFVFNRLTGPGRVGLQSAYFSGEGTAAAGAVAGGAAGGVGGAALGGLLGGLLGGNN